MKTNIGIATAVALLLSVGTYAQNQPEVPKMKPRHSPEEQAVKRAEKKLAMKDMTRSERRAFKKTQREQRQARLAAMSPEKRARVMERRRQRQAGK